MQPIAITADAPGLFLDDRIIERTTRLSRAWHQPRKVNGPVLAGKHAWDRSIVSYGTVIHHQGQFHHWYTTWVASPTPRVCLATSIDGVTWETPSLDQHETPGKPGDKANNIVLVSGHETQGGLIDNISVIHEPHDALYPFKSLYWDSGPRPARPGHEGMFAARSRDGIRWELLGCVLPDMGDRFNACLTRLEGKYVAWVRAPGMFKTWPPTRRIYRIESEDLLHWSAPRLVLEPDHEDPDLMQYYSLVGAPYAGLTLGFLERMNVSPDTLDTELLWSYDHGNTFQRARTRQAFLSPGPKGAWDDTWTSITSNGVITHDNRLWFYYSGRTEAHGLPHPHKAGAIGLATLRIDGFCSIKAAEMPGVLITQTLAWPLGTTLCVNLDTRRNLHAHPANTVSGELRAEVQTPDGQPIPGLTLDDCIPMTRNTANAAGSYEPIKWSTGKTLAHLEGKPIRLRFVFRDAHLYGIKPGTATPA